MIRQGKKTTHKCFRAEDGFPGPSKVQGPVSKPNSVGCYRQLNNSSLHKQGGSHSAEMCALLWKIMTLCHHYQIALKAKHIPGCLNVMADLLSRSNQVQSTEWSLHPQVFKQICHKWSTPHVNLFATHLNHKVPVHISSPRPKCLGHRCSEHKLVGSHCLCLPSHGSPSQGDPKDQTMKLPDHCNSPRLTRDALVLGPSAALNRDPTSSTNVKNSSQTVNHVFHNNPHISTSTPDVLEWTAPRKSSLWRWQRELLPLRDHQQGPSTSHSGPYLRNGAEKIRWISPLPL